MLNLTRVRFLIVKKRKNTGNTVMKTKASVASRIMFVVLLVGIALTINWVCKKPVAVHQENDTVAEQVAPMPSEQSIEQLTEVQVDAISNELVEAKATTTNNTLILNFSDFKLGSKSNGKLSN